MQSNKQIKIFLETLYASYNTPAFIATDPVVFPHTLEGNKEYIAFTAALFAYGNVTAMQKFLSGMFESTGTDPANLRSNSKGLKYRFQSAADVDAYLKVMKDIYKDHGTLENFFRSFPGSPLSAAAGAMRAIHDIYIKDTTRGLNFLFTIPGKSASKRLYMFLRWMVRKDSVDFGLWEKYDPAELSIPLDTHIKKLSVNLGVIKPGDSDKKALESVNAYFKKLNPPDPVKYDFALTRLGIAHKCKYEKSPVCFTCKECGLCIFIDDKP